MDRSGVCYLVSKTRSQDNLGVWVSTQTERKVYCQVDSVSQSEWFEGGRAGLNPALRFRMFRYDYNNEDTIIYNGQEYRIYRSYFSKTDTIDLYTELRKGNG